MLLLPRIFEVLLSRFDSSILSKVFGVSLWTLCVCVKFPKKRRQANWYAATLFLMIILKFNVKTYAPSGIPYLVIRSMLLQNHFYNIKAQSAAARLPAAWPFHPVESAKEFWYVILRQVYPRVLYGKLYSSVLWMCRIYILLSPWYYKAYFFSLATIP